MRLLIIAFLRLSMGYIIYDTNLYQGLDNTITSGFICLNNIKTSTINFSGTFANVPQIILTFDKYDMEKPAGFQFSITSVTVSEFSVKLECFSKKVFKYHFRWHAIDDSRIEVINCFNQIPVLTQTIPHSNPNALYGFVSITSFVMSGISNFISSITSITDTSVIINLSSITNLDSIGYQIILGLDSSFSSFTMQSFTSAYTSPSLRIEKNKFFLLPLCGFNYANNDNIRLEKFFTITGDNLVYVLQQWWGSYIPNYHLEVQIPYDYITISRAVKASHLQITAFEDYSQTLSSNFQIKIYESNQIFENIGVFQAEIIDTTNIVNIDVLLKCSQNYKITVKLNYCGTCSNQGRYELERSCYGSMNRYKFRTRFQTTFLAKKQLTITITQQSLIITQLVYTETQISVQTQLNILQMTLQNV